MVNTDSKGNQLPVSESGQLPFFQVWFAARAFVDTMKKVPDSAVEINDAFVAFLAESGWSTAEWSKKNEELAQSMAREQVASAMGIAPEVLEEQGDPGKMN